MPATARACSAGTRLARPQPQSSPGGRDCPDGCAHRRARPLQDPRAGTPATARDEQVAEYTELGSQLFANNCSSCHGDHGEGEDAPTLNAKEFLQTTTDEQIRLITAGGITGTEMPTWSIDMGGSLTDQQIEQIVTYMRSWESTAPSVPDWRAGKDD